MPASAGDGLTRPHYLRPLADKGSRPLMLDSSLGLLRLTRYLRCAPHDSPALTASHTVLHAANPIHAGIIF